MQLVSFDGTNNFGAIDGKISGSVLEKKCPFKIVGFPFSSSKLDWAFTLSPC